MNTNNESDADLKKILEIQDKIMDKNYPLVSVHPEVKEEYLEELRRTHQMIKRYTLIRQEAESKLGQLRMEIEEMQEKSNAVLTSAYPEFNGGILFLTYDQAAVFKAKFDINALPEFLEIIAGQ